MEERFLDMAGRLMPLPTAPYCERFVAAEAAAIAADMPLVTQSVDAHGNLLILYDGAPSGQRLTVTAHLDHPGLVYAARLSARDHLFEKGGGVPVELARNAAVRIYSLDEGPEQSGLKGRVTAYCDADSAPVQSHGLQGPAFRVRTETTVDLDSGAFAMLDLKPFQVRGDRVRGRACDDLAGVAVGLTWLSQMATSGADCRCGLLLTRAEEVGFGGMVAAIEAGYLETDALYINVECSSERPGAPLGEGPVVRVGDRAWIFSPEITAALSAVADGLIANATGPAAAPRFQRQLMDAGTCEATALARAGFTTGAVALPLRNYHNHGKGRLAAEADSLSDAAGLVRLLVELAIRPGGATQALAQTTSRMDQQMRARYTRHDARLRQTRDSPSSNPKEVGP